MFFSQCLFSGYPNLLSLACASDIEGAKSFLSIAIEHDVFEVDPDFGVGRTLGSMTGYRVRVADFVEGFFELPELTPEILFAGLGLGRERIELIVKVSLTAGGESA